MKKLILSIGVLSSVAAMAQTGNVGINTSTPAATLDVVGQPANTAKLDGIIAPRLAGAELRAKTYTAAQTGALVYATAADTAPAGQTVNVTSAGYYYFDGSVWVKTGGSGATVPTGPTNGNFWGLTGNAGTVLGTNFLGTTDAVPLQFRVNNTHSGLVSQFIDNATTPTGGNVALGYNAMRYAGTVVPSTASPVYRQNIAVGWNAMTATPTGNMVQNVAVGDRSLMAFTSGGTNIAIGDKAMGGAVAGDSNIGIGVDALTALNNSQADNWGNIALGFLAGSKLTQGRSNIILRNQTSGNQLTTGDRNLLVGVDSGTGLQNGSQNIALGTTSALLDNTSNQLNIQNTIYGSTMGSADAKVGIVASTTTLPTENFDVNGTARVRNLPTNGATNAIYTSGANTTTATKANTFTATRTVVADANGVLGTVAGLPGAGGAAVTASNGLTATGSNVVLGGTLTQATTVAQGTNNMTFSNSGAGRFIVDGTYQGNGAVYETVRLVTNPITYQANDYVLVLNDVNLDGNLVLPSAAANPGRIIYLSNGTTQGITFSGSATADTKAFNYSVVSVSAGPGFISDGTTWRILGR